MNDLNDPRRSKYFDSNVDDPATPEVEYIGGTNGGSNSFPNFTHISPTLQVPDFPGTILDYAQAKFLLAEAAERSLYGSPATAATHYNAAITASILDWGGTEAEAAAYLVTPNVAYTTAPGTWKQKIGIQSWIAYYNNSFEGWSTYRRLDYPVLVAPADAVSAIPVRYTYPIIEQSLNKSSYTAASQAIGGDNVDTKLFWDKF